MFIFANFIFADFGLIRFARKKSRALQDFGSGGKNPLD